jgi:hypothetical protein
VASGTHVETAPAFAHPNRIEKTDAERVVKPLEKLETFALELLRIEPREHVLGHSREVSDAPVFQSSEGGQVSGQSQSVRVAAFA